MKTNREKILELHNSGNISYLKDDFLDFAIRILPPEYTIYLKYRGKREKLITKDNETFYNILCGGEFITKKEYDNFS